MPLIFDIPPDAYDLPEQMGTKFKFWYQDPLLGRTLFKEGRPNTGENWAEKLAGELALMLGIPHAVYEFARWRDKQGVLSPSFVPTAGRLIHGNELLGGRVTEAQDDKQIKYYAQRSHTASAVIALLKSDFIHPPRDYMGELKAIDIFVGYLLFDAWIANQDRHSENWGLVRLRETLYLAPSYDHGSSLARNESDEKRSHILVTKDKGSSLDTFCRRARSALYPTGSVQGKVRSLLTTEAFEFAWQHTNNECGNFWLDRLAAITPVTIRDTIQFIPDELMTPVSKEFTEQLLLINRNRLLAMKK